MVILVHFMRQSLVDKYTQNIESFRAMVNTCSPKGHVDIRSVLLWLHEKRKRANTKTKLVPISALSDWVYDMQDGGIRYKKNRDYFFSVYGLTVEHATDREVTRWNQPILVQKEGGVLVILSQKRDRFIKFLLRARYEPGNIQNIQLGPTVQATQSNLKQHHAGEKPLFSEYINHPKTTVIYSTKHNEEGGRFWRKSNTNILLFLDSEENIRANIKDGFLWLTLPEVKKLMLCDHVVNPFVKTVLSPL